MEKVNWIRIEKDKLFIEYFLIPNKYVVRFIGKTRISNVNECNESDLYFFDNFEEIEKFILNQF